jgi:pyruvate formate-lyase activating enzyme-like uncharacterized protein
LKAKGAIFRNNDKSIYIKKISPACFACKKGDRDITVKISNLCNRQCYFCYTYGLKDKKIVDPIANLKAKIKDQQKVQVIGITGGEPFLHQKEVLKFLQWVNKKMPDLHTRIYTNGDLISEKLLQELQEAHLTEIRYSLKPEDLDNWAKLSKIINLSKKYIPNVLVEMPIMPGSFTQMKEILLELDKLRIFGINLLEFTYYGCQATEFNGRGFRVKWPPFDFIYQSRSYQGWPIAQSDLECLKLIEFALDHKLKIGINYCSLANRLTPDLYNRNYLYNNLDTKPLYYFSKKDYLLKSALVCGMKDIIKVLKIFKINKINNYRLINASNSRKMLEFAAAKILLLVDLKSMEIGLASSLVDNNQPKIIKIQVTKPDLFDLKRDL